MKRRHGWPWRSGTVDSGMSKLMYTPHDDDLATSIRAFEWFERLKRLDGLGQADAAAEQAAFAEWLKKGPSHVRHFLIASALERELEHVEFTTTESPQFQPQIRRSPWRAVAAVAAITAVGLGSIFYSLSEGKAYRTGIGEQETVKLTDGSTIRVNAVSDLTVKYTTAERGVSLQSGEALFDVAKDSGRPFRVHIDKVVVEAVGTQFNVYRKSGWTTVSVLEGVTRLSGGGGASVAVSAGEASQITDGHIGPAVRTNVARAVAWQEHRLDFNDETLMAIANEFNRYNRLQLDVQGEALRKRKVTATFSSTDVKAFLDYLYSEADLVVEEGEDTVVIRAKSDSEARPR